MRDELAGRDIAVRMNVDEAYGAFQRPRKGLKRVEQRYERAVEEPMKDSLRAGLPEGRQRLVLAPLGAEVAGGAPMAGPVPSSGKAAATGRVSGPEPADNHGGYPSSEVVRKRLNLP